MDSQQSALRPVTSRKSLEVQIVNHLHKDHLIYHGVYFDSGGWYQQKIASIQPNNDAHSTVSSKDADNSVSFGMSWKIGQTGKFLVLGCTKTRAGMYKTSVDISHGGDPKVGYDKAKNDELEGREKGIYMLKATMENSTIYVLKATIESSFVADTKIVFDITDHIGQPIDQPDNPNGPDQPNPQSWFKIITGAAAVVVTCLMPFSPEFRRVFLSELLGIAVRFLNATKEE